MTRRPRPDAQLLAEVRERLRAAGIGSPEAEARLLVEHVAERSGVAEGALEELVARRAAREPLQLVLGRTWFRWLELRCAPGVFIPRPETEVVAGLAIDAARAARGEGGAATVRVVEPCTGTGAIALSVAVEVPGVTVLAGDVDPAAVALATDNLGRVRSGRAGARLAAGSEVRVVRSELLTGMDPAWQGTLDVLVANPPYLPAADRGTWEPEVAAHDPDRALVGGPDGHEVVDALLAAACTWLRPGGTVVLEIDERRGEEVREVATRLGLAGARIVGDLTGADRAVVATRPQAAGPAGSQ